MQLINCTYEQHAAAILDIFNDAIMTSTAVYDYQPRPLEFMRGWFDAKQSKQLPVLGMVDATGTLLGFVSYGSFRARPAYQYTIEHSVYVHKEHRGKGIGSKLLTAIITAAQAEQYHVLVGGIDIENLASIALHEKLGFTHCGTIKQAGFKFGRWLDLGFYQLTLNTPSNPTDGEPNIP